MRHVYKTDDDLPTTIAETLSNSTKKGMRQIADTGQPAINLGLRAARNLQDSRVVKYAQTSPVKTAGIVVLGGLLAYSLYSIVVNKRNQGN